jgi:hypothetical protein
MNKMDYRSLVGYVIVRSAEDSFALLGTGCATSSLKCRFDESNPYSLFYEIATPFGLAMTR